MVKSHGGADAKGFANAIRVAADLARSDYRRPRSPAIWSGFAAALAPAQPGRAADGDASVSVLRSAVTGVGGYLPDEIVTNDDLAKIVDTTDEWIASAPASASATARADDQPTSDLAVEAARRAPGRRRPHAPPTST